MKVSRKKLRRLIKESLLSEAKPSKRSSKVDRLYDEPKEPTKKIAQKVKKVDKENVVNALNTVKDALGAGEFKIDSKVLKNVPGLRNLPNFGNISLSTEFKQKDDGTIEFGIDPKYSKSLKLSEDELAQLTFEISPSGVAVNPAAKIPFLGGALNVGVKFKGDFKDLPKADVAKSFDGAYINFTKKFK